MTKKLFIGTTNGLELWVDAPVLEKLRQEQESRLATRLNADGTKKNKKATRDGRTPEQAIQNLLDGFKKINGCWIWQRSIQAGDYAGYGHSWFCGKHVKTHRLIYMLTHGSITHPCVCHRCDVPACGNPEHLFGGTKQDNSIDREQKGRGYKPCGEFGTASKLTDLQVEKIRTQYKRGSKEFNMYVLADGHNVSQAAIWSVIHGRTWKQRPDPNPARK